MVSSLASVVLLSLASTSLAAPFFPNGTTTVTSASGVKLATTSLVVTTSKATVSSKAVSTSAVATQKPSVSSVAASSSAAASKSTAASGSPKTFKGDGSAAAGWPTIDQWADYTTILANNQQILSSSCTQFDKENNTPAEIADIDSSVQSVAKSTGVDPRFILAVIMQESKGCVRVHDTISPDGTVRNPGLMQDHNGPNSCANVTVPCPAATITGMISDGTNGTEGITGGGDGLKQTLAQATGTDKLADAQAVYVAARIYNSGSYTVGTDLGAGAATASYASDIANRLLGLAF